MGHGTGVPQPCARPHDETSAVHDRAWAGDDRKRWVKGTTSLVSQSMPNAAVSLHSSNTSAAGERRTELGASKLFYSKRVMSGSEDETIACEIVDDRTPSTYLTADYVGHMRHPSYRMTCGGSHSIQFLLREQNRLLRAAFVAEHAARVRQYESSFQNRAGEA
jgi:hypothetical protein